MGQLDAEHLSTVHQSEQLSGEQQFQVLLSLHKESSRTWEDLQTAANGGVHGRPLSADCEEA